MTGPKSALGLEVVRVCGRRVGQSHLLLRPAFHGVERKVTSRPFAEKTMMTSSAYCLGKRIERPGFGWREVFDSANLARGSLQPCNLARLGHEAGKFSVVKTCHSRSRSSWERLLFGYQRSRHHAEALLRPAVPEKLFRWLSHVKFA